MARSKLTRLLFPLHLKKDAIADKPSLSSKRAMLLRAVEIRKRKCPFRQYDVGTNITRLKNKISVESAVGIAQPLLCVLPHPRRCAKKRINRVLLITY